MHAYVCMYVSLYVRMYVCIVCMYVCVYVCMYVGDGGEEVYVILSRVFWLSLPIPCSSSL